MKERVDTDRLPDLRWASLLDMIVCDAAGDVIAVQIAAMRQHIDQVLETATALTLTYVSLISCSAGAWHAHRRLRYPPPEHAQLVLPMALST